LRDPAESLSVISVRGITNAKEAYYAEQSKQIDRTVAKLRSLPK